MKKLSFSKVLALVCILMAGIAGLYAQQVEQTKVDGAAAADKAASKPALQPANAPSAQSVADATKFLEGLVKNEGVSAEREQRITGFIKKLADQSFEVREKATEELKKEGEDVVPFVEKAASDTDDEEVKARCEIVLNAVKGKGKSVAADISRAVSVLTLANQTKVVGLLIDLLGNDDVQVRSSACQRLVSLTEESFGYNASDNVEKRQQAMEKWKAWWGKNRDTFTIKVSANKGFLACDLEAKSVTAFNNDGETLWTRNFDDPPSSAVCLPNGNLLVAFRGEPGYAAELDSSGKSLWSTKNFKLEVASICAEASRMANGDTLLAFPHDGKVIEVTPAGKIVAQITELGHPHAAQPTPDGNIMIMEHQPFKISIYNNEGKLVKVISEEGTGFDAVPLPGGHVLLSTMNSPNLQELDSDGNRVWSRDCPGRPTTAARLPNGNTVLSNGVEGVAIVNQQGEVVKTLVKHQNYSPWTGKIRLMAPLGIKGAATSPASAPASGPSSAPAALDPTKPQTQ